MTLRWWPEHKKIPRGWKAVSYRVHSQGIVEILILKAA